MLLQILFFSVTLTAAEINQPTRSLIKIMYNDGEGGCDSDGFMPVCGTGTEWDGTSCVSNSDGLMSACGTGTELVGTKCVPSGSACGTGTELVGTACVPSGSACGTGTEWDGTSCVPSGSACGTGTRWVGTACVSENPCITPETSLQYITSGAYTSLFAAADSAMSSGSVVMYYAESAASAAYTADAADAAGRADDFDSASAVYAEKAEEAADAAIDAARDAAISAAYATLNPVYVEQQQLTDAADAAAMLAAEIAFEATNHLDYLNSLFDGGHDDAVEHLDAISAATAAKLYALGVADEKHIAYLDAISAATAAKLYALGVAERFYEEANLCI